MKLREYQEKSVNELAIKLAEGKRKVVYQLATGGGKRKSAIILILSAYRHPVLAYQPFRCIALPFPCGQSTPSF